MTLFLEGGVANAMVDFEGHTASLVAVISDVVRNGARVTGVAFGSIGRFGQHGIISERIAPRLTSASPESLLDEETGTLVPSQVAAVAMRGEKPGGHGDRATAVAAVELAVWDLIAKLADEPAYATISRHVGRPGHERGVPVYAAGGYYSPDGSVDLTDEFRDLQERGFRDFKMKVGAASLAEDLRRVESVCGVVGPEHLAVDANGRFGSREVMAYADALAPYGLRWFEEPVDPLDFELLRQVIERFPSPVATGENLFATSDVRNLLRYGGMRPGTDVFQMDAGLSYGLTEYVRMLDLLEATGHDRASAYPHGGHLINVHIATGLGLGGCEAYPTVFAPVGGFSDECSIEGGRIRPGTSPGFGLEAKGELRPLIAQLIA